MYNGISFFSNAGIGDMGVESAGVRILIANELIEKRAKTYQANHKNTEVIIGDINKITNEQFIGYKKKFPKEEVFLMVATPPCQGVSTAGRRNQFDIRNQLIKPTVKAIKKLKPLWIWMENVPTYDKITIPDCEEIVADNEEYVRITIIDYLKKHLVPEGYKIEYRLLDTKDFGLPQSRRRLFFIMTRTDRLITFPEKTHGTINGLKPYKTLRDAIGHLEPLESGEKSKKDAYHYALNHNEKHIKWMKATPEGKSAFDNEKFEEKPTVIDKETGELRLIKAFKNTYKRVRWDEPSPTITMASGVISSQENVHPCDTRTLSVREIMEVMTMPKTYKFLEDTTDKEMRDMIGEGVPSKMAEIITTAIIKTHEN